MALSKEEITARGLIGILTDSMNTGESHTLMSEEIEVGKMFYPQMIATFHWVVDNFPNGTVNPYFKALIEHCIDVIHECFIDPDPKPITQQAAAKLLWFHSTIGEVYVQVMEHYYPEEFHKIANDFLSDMEDAGFEFL